MKNRNVQKLEAITPGTLIVGVDIAKETQWAQCINYRGQKLRKALKFKNHKNGFDSILAGIEAICKNTNCLIKNLNEKVSMPHIKI